MGTALAWTQLPPPVAEPVLAPDEPLRLNPSALDTYAQCPRLYFYRNLLRLPDRPRTEASLGTLIHRLMELFLNDFSAAGCPPAQYTAQALQALADRWLALPNLPAESLEPPFTSADRSALATLSPLARRDLDARLRACIQDLGQKGFFADPPVAVETEVSIPETAFPEVPGALFLGRVDALLTDELGGVTVLDFKTYGPHAFDAKKPETLVRYLSNVLEPIPPEATTHAERFGGDTPRLYQLPLYALLLETLPEWQSRIQTVALQIIRPAFPDNPEQGSIRIPLDLMRLVERREGFLSDLSEFVVQPIRTGGDFAPEPGRGCLTCAYRRICEGAGLGG